MSFAKLWSKTPVLMDFTNNSTETIFDSCVHDAVLRKYITCTIFNIDQCINVVQKLYYNGIDT